MGNICSRSANKPDDPFAQPGRPLGSSNPAGNKQSTTAPVPNKGKPSFSSPGRTLGGDAAGQSGSEDVKTKAAVAAQVCLLYSRSLPERWMRTLGC